MSKGLNILVGVIAVHPVGKLLLSHLYAFWESIGTSHLYGIDLVVSGDKAHFHFFCLSYRQNNEEVCQFDQVT